MPPCFCSNCESDRRFTPRKVRRARRIIAKNRCPATGIRHRWIFDGYFWHHCRNCKEVS